MWALHERTGVAHMVGTNRDAPLRRLAAESTENCVELRMTPAEEKEEHRAERQECKQVDPLNSEAAPKFIAQCIPEEFQIRCAALKARKSVTTCHPRTPRRPPFALRVRWALSSRAPDCHTDFHGRLQLLRTPETGALGHGRGNQSGLPPAF